MRTEFDFINSIKKRYRLDKVGDDCAVLPKNGATDLLITSDMLVESVDFRLEWAGPEQIGHKALAVSLSDIAAMGGMPTFALVSVAVEENLWKTTFLDKFYKGWHKLAAKFGVVLVGGDVSRTQGPLVIDSTVLGEVPKDRAIVRSGARAGDGIFVAGSLGGAAGGLKLLTEGEEICPGPGRELIRKQLQPNPQLAAAKYLLEQGLTTSMIDISDGLSSDLTHICVASGVGAEIDVSRLPVERALRELFTEAEALELAINGGEDLALLFTGDYRRGAPVRGATRIGTITSHARSIETIDAGVRRKFEPSGYRHF
jgi:thiamine-monophosphate kinase